MLGSWRHDAAGLCYEIRLPPAAMVWTSDFTIEEMIAWIGRHIVRHVQKAFGKDELVRVRASPDLDDPAACEGPSWPHVKVAAAVTVT